ncbi:MAG: tetratricopeptide repeat protein [Planctomycetales bacterium]|nr:tetratricopeptide repeat protein [Planctomycetales bacterium]
MSNDPQRVQEIFLRVVELPPEQRALALDQACGSDVELKRQVELLLMAHEGSDSLLDRTDNFARTVESGEGLEGFASQDRSNPSAAARTSSREETIEFQATTTSGMDLGGRYRLQEIIGEGGMGEVWVAKQTSPVRRKVAIKLIKRGMDSRAVLNRFEQERQALALMDHPNIARVLDAGMSATGQPYFVMELVNGLPLTKFCDQAMLAPKARLELFVSVCQAVQHAHQKGIVHRDLKPANILVTVIDGKPIPKVIDFGVAKAVGGKLTDESMSTQFGAVVGTLEYMSPEQAGYSGVDVDTRADIYSLGVILYELLTGLRPLDAVRLKQAALTEMIRIIQEEEPSKPSTRLSTDASLPTASALRQMEPRKLMALLRGELDWVVMKCLEKKRDRRYETVNALARDILSYLANEPVEARPPSTTYRVKKFLTRHKLPVTAAALVMASLIIGIIGTTASLLEARRQKDIADEERGEANLARIAEGERAESERKAHLFAEERRLEAERQSRIAEDRLLEVEAAQRKAEQEKAIAEAVGDFLKLKLLSQADVATQADSLLSSGGRVADAKEDPTIRELLDRAAVELSEAKIDESFPDQPLVQAEILQTVGSSYVGVGAYRRAVPFLVRSLAIRKELLGAEAQETISSMNSLAIATLNAGDIKDAVTLFEEAMRLTKLHFPDDTDRAIQIMSNLAKAYQDAGKLDEGLELCKESQRLREETLDANDPEIVIGMASLGASYFTARQHQRAFEILTSVLPNLQETLGRDHPTTLFCMNNLSTCLGALDRSDEALAVQQQVYELTVSKFGAEHPFSLMSQVNLAGSYRSVRNPTRAMELLESAIEIESERFGVSHPLTLHAMVGLADIHMQLGDLDRAVALQSEALASYQEIFGPNHPDTIVTESNLAAIYARMQKPQASLPIFQRVLEKRRVINGPEHPWTMLALEDVGANYLVLGQIDEGRAMLEEAYAHAAIEPELLDVVIRLTTLDFAEGHGDVGLRRLEDALPQYEQLRGPDHRGTLKCLGWIATSHYKLREFDEAIEIFEALLPRQTALLGPDDPDTIETLRNLAANYYETGRLPETLDKFREVLERSVKSHNPDLPKHMRVALGAFSRFLRSGDAGHALELADIILANCPAEAVTDASNFAEFLSVVASIHNQLGNKQKVIEVLEQGIGVLKQIEDPISTGTLRLIDIYGATCWQSREFERAIEAYLPALDARERQLGRDHLDTIRTIANLGSNYKDNGQIDQAIPLLEEAYQASSEQPAVSWVGFTLLDAYVLADRTESAASLANELFQSTQQDLQRHDSKRSQQTAVIAMALLKLQLFAEAEPVARELLSIRQETQPDNWSTFNSMSMLGGALLGQGKFDEAEDLLLQGYEGMQARKDSIPAEGKPRLAEAISRLVELYTATNQIELADRFQKEMAELEEQEEPEQ